MAGPRYSPAGSLALALPALLLAGAYVSQYGFGLFPCEMCWWQRWPHFIAVGFALLASITGPRRGLIALAGLAVLVSGLIGVFHAGVEWDWWEGITGCAVHESGGGSALEEILAAPITRCVALATSRGPVRRTADDTGRLLIHPLTASLGRDSRELQRSLATVVEASVVERVETTPAATDRPQPTLLALLQADVREDRVPDADEEPEGRPAAEARP